MTAASAKRLRDPPGTSVAAVFLMPNGENEGVALLLASKSPANEASSIVQQCAATVAAAGLGSISPGPQHPAGSLMLFTQAGLPFMAETNAFEPAIQEPLAPRDTARCIDAALLWHYYVIE